MTVHPATHDRSGARPDTALTCAGLKPAPGGPLITITMNGGPRPLWVADGQGDGGLGVQQVERHPLGRLRSATPIFALIAFFLFGETLSAVQLLGMAVTVLAVALAAK